MNAVAQDIDEQVDEILAYCKGDAVAAIKTLLNEREFLLKEIEYASLAMSFGFARGWKPTLFDR